MERFLQYVVAGGLAVVAGLWLVELATPHSGPWLAASVLAIAGAGVLCAGVSVELET